MILEKPIVSTMVSGIETQIHEGINGYIVPFKTEALVEKIAVLMDDTELRDKMSGNNRKILKDIPQLNNLLDDIFQNALLQS